MSQKEKLKQIRDHIVPILVDQGETGDLSSNSSKYYIIYNNAKVTSNSCVRNDGGGKLGRTVSLREQLERFGWKNINFTDVSMDPETSAIHIRVQMDRHSFTLIAMPISKTPITWLNSISLEEKGPETEKILRDLQRIFHFQRIFRSGR